MTIWIAILFGIVQGITEFLPVSSSGHLLLLGSILGQTPSQTLVLLLHFASLVAIIIFFWNDIIDCLKHPFGKKSTMLFVATICTALVALSLSKFEFVSSAVFLGPCFVASGLILLFARFVPQKATPNFFASAIAVGTLQGLCVLPGLSRLGTTTSCLNVCGHKNNSTTFSFLLAIPVVVGGIVLSVAKGNFLQSSVSPLALIVSFVAAFVVSCLAVFLLKKLENRWWVFAPYLIVLGVAVCIWQYI